MIVMAHALRALAAHVWWFTTCFIMGFVLLFHLYL